MADSVDPLPKVELAGGYGRRFPRGGHYLRNAGIAVTTFVVSCAIIHELLPFPEIPEVTPKLRYFAAHKDEFDTLFVGSSHIYREIVPVTFDRVSAEHGTPTHSFNLAVGGMLPPESLYFLEQALRAKPANLKWVFVELQELQAKWPRERRETQRFLYWHTWQLTRSTIESTINPERSQRWWQALGHGVRSRTVAVHLATFIKNFANVGGARDLQDLDALQKRSDFDNEEFVRRRGHTGLDQPMSAKDAEDYLTQLRRWSAHAHSRPVDAITDETYRDCARAITAAGAKPIFVLAPTPGQVELRFRGSAPLPGPTLVFNRAGEYPAFYDPAVRADVEHLTADGAETFTRMLAERFANEVANRKHD